LGATAGEGNAIGFGRDLQKTGEDDKAVKDFFKPEFRNRLDGIVKFAKLDQVSMRRIVGKFVGEINVLLAERSITVRLSESAIDEIISTGFDAKMGARPVQRKINDLVKVPLSKKILFDNIGPNTTMVVDFVNKEFTFDAKSSFDITLQPTVNEDGFIILDPVKS
jgi:ATP-dependent Clp protease ATP-binding subunit ClpA